MPDLLPASFYLPVEGDRYLATAATEGPWSPELQHGGPPSALLVRAMQRLPGPEPGRLTRVTLEFLGAVPTSGELTATARVERDGRSVQLLGAALGVGGREVMRARAWRLRTDDGLPSVPWASASLRGPHEVDEGLPGFTFGYAATIEWRSVGSPTQSPGPAAVWARPRLPLVAGEELSPEQLAVLVADSGSGLSWELPWAEWSFVNVDLSVAFGRRPEGAWVALDAATTMPGDGTGAAWATLHDLRGPFGRSTQSLLVSPRP